MADKPKTFDEYMSVEGEALRLPPKIKYQMNLNLMEQEVLNSPFVAGLARVLEEAAAKYSTNEKLLFAFKPQPPTITSKPYESSLDKCYRVNCVYNRNYPGAPKDGKIEGGNLYEAINDILRGRLVCRYMDGPEFVCRALQEHAQALGLESNVYAMSSERGYYAWHFYVRLPVNVIIESDVEEKFAQLEIQVTTQLADVLTDLTHGLYEAERSAPPAKRDDSWKWEPDQTRFKSAFMGHTLHMLEGIILTLKDEVIGPRAKTEPTPNGVEGSNASPIDACAAPDAAVAESEDINENPAGGVNNEESSNGTE